MTGFYDSVGCLYTTTMYETDGSVSYINHPYPNENHRILENTALENALREVFPNMPNEPGSALDFIVVKAADYDISIDDSTTADQQLVDLCKKEATQREVSEQQKQRAEARNQSRTEAIKTASETKGIPTML